MPDLASNLPFAHLYLGRSRQACMDLLNKYLFFPWLGTVQIVHRKICKILQRLGKVVKPATVLAFGQCNFNARFWAAQEIIRATIF